jgi:hypothetical protein
MKRIFGTTLILTLFLVTSACVKNNVIDNPSNGSELTVSDGNISIAPSTGRSRAVISTVLTLQGDVIGFRVFGTTANNASSWYTDVDGKKIDGNNNHLFSNNKWNFSQAVKWPTDAAAYPMTFHACHPAYNAGSTISSVGAIGLKINYKVDGNIGNQKDFLVGTSVTGNAKPVDGKLSINFEHALSKVDFGLKVETGYTAQLLKIGVREVCTNGSYEFAAKQWTPVDVMPGTGGEFDYYNSTASGVAKEFIGENRSEPVSDDHLMMIPQDRSTSVWNPTSGNLEGTHVLMIYRAASATDTHFIGYDNATGHPNYVGSATELADYTGPLFVMVGYPVTVVWNKGKGYIYNIEIPGTSGGVLISDKYTDINGIPTDLPVEGVNLYEPILGDEFIHLVPKVSDWTDVSPGTLSR